MYMIARKFPAVLARNDHWEPVAVFYWLMYAEEFVRDRNDPMLVIFYWPENSTWTSLVPVCRVSVSLPISLVPAAESVAGGGPPIK